MINKEIIGYITTKTNIKRRDLLEKDLLLHQILSLLVKDKHFSNNYVFKGGTCLTKCYLGYYRFSEDLDFSWIEQKIFDKKTEKQIRKELSQEITKLAKILENVAHQLGLNFKADKTDLKFMEFGGNNKFTTFKIWYTSVELGTDQFMKIQINYVEKFMNKMKQVKAKNILEEKKIDAKEFSFLFPNNEVLLKTIEVKAYDIKEIAIEKMRAILTRKGMKARDYVDLYMIERKYKIKIESLKNEIIEKTKFMLRYEKYGENLKAKAESRPMFALRREEDLLLQPLDEKFYDFVKRLEKVIDDLIYALK